MSDDTNNNTEHQGEPELGEAGKRAIAAERTRADAAERRVRELEASIGGFETQIADLTSERDTLTADLGNKDATITRLNVGIDKGLPKSLIARLQGDDEDALLADADALLEFVPADSKPSPRPDPSQGSKDTGTPSTAQQFADAFPDL